MSLSRIAIGIALGLVLAPKAHAFSQDFTKYATGVQAQVMLKGQRFTTADAKRFWDKFDEEIVSLLSQNKKADALNKEGEPIELSQTEAKGGEQEVLELGTVAAKFFSLDVGGKTWLVALSNNMYAGSDPLPTGTLRVYQEKDGKFQRVAASDELKGPWDADKILFSNIQVQVIRSVSKGTSAQFASFYRPASRDAKANRSQIVWDFDVSQKDTSLKPVLYFPEVDFHTVGDQQVPGRGDPVIVQ